ncbi:hypothetical protein KCP74_16400 [Salmonella enterica subsp. enterica]|nr:hypothetical protein KCP74_16400 [Salmonella enterica subsp. enterica]
MVLRPLDLCLRYIAVTRRSVSKGAKRFLRVSKGTTCAVGAAVRRGDVVGCAASAATR